MESHAGSIRPGGRSARVRHAILTASREVLGAAGWGGFSVEEVARRAGVHKTTVYRRWPTRLELAVAALADRAQTTVPIADTGTLRGDLRALTRSVLDSLADPEGGGLARALVAEIAVNPEVAHIGRAFFRNRFAHSDEIVRRAAARDEVPGSVDVGLLVESVVAPIWFRFLTTGDLPTRRRAYRVVDMLLDGVLSDGPTARSSGDGGGRI